MKKIFLNMIASVKSHRVASILTITAVLFAGVGVGAAYAVNDGSLPNPFVTHTTDTGLVITTLPEKITPEEAQKLATPSPTDSPTNSATPQTDTQPGSGGVSGGSNTNAGGNSGGAPSNNTPAPTGCTPPQVFSYDHNRCEDWAPQIFAVWTPTPGGVDNCPAGTNDFDRTSCAQGSWVCPPGHILGSFGNGHWYCPVYTGSW